MKRRPAARQYGAMEFSSAPVDLDLVRLRDRMKVADIAGLLLFDPINTRYAIAALRVDEKASSWKNRY